MSDLPVRATVSAACHQIIRGARDLRVLSTPLQPEVLSPIGLQAITTALTALRDLISTAQQDVAANVRMMRPGFEPQEDQSFDLTTLDSKMADAVAYATRLQRRAQNAMNQRCGHCERHAELRTGPTEDGTEYDVIVHKPTCPLFRVATDARTDPTAAGLRAVQQQEESEE